MVLGVDGVVDDVLEGYIGAPPTITVFSVAFMFWACALAATPNTATDSAARNRVITVLPSAVVALLEDYAADVE